MPVSFAVAKNLCVVFLSVFLIGSTEAQAPVESVTRGAIVGYASNIDAFPHYRCRFKTTRGTADTEADAKAARGKVGDVVESLAVKDGEFELLELLGDTKIQQPTAEEMRASKGGVIYSVRKGHSNEKYLRDGKSFVTYDSDLQTLHLNRPNDGPSASFTATVHCPLYTWYQDRGRFGPDQMLVNSAKYTPTYLGERTTSGSLVGVRFDGQKYADGSAHESETWFDRDRGYLPVEYRTRSMPTDAYRNGAITEVKEFRPGRYFPMRRVMWWGDEKGPGKWHYAEVVVLELDVENRPTQKDFSTVFPAGTQVLGAGGYFKLKQEERLSPNDLDELFDKLERSKSEPQMDTAIEHTGERKGWWMWAAVGGAGLILLGVWLWWRKRRLARRASP